MAIDVIKDMIQRRYAAVLSARRLCAQEAAALPFTKRRWPDVQLLIGRITNRPPTPAPPPPPQNNVPFHANVSDVFDPTVYASQHVVLPGVDTSRALIMPVEAGPTATRQLDVDTLRSIFVATGQHFREQGGHDQHPAWFPAPRDAEGRHVDVLGPAFNKFVAEAREGSEYRRVANGLARISAPSYEETLGKRKALGETAIQGAPSEVARWAIRKLKAVIKPGAYKVVKPDDIDFRYCHCTRCSKTWLSNNQAFYGHLCNAAGGAEVEPDFHHCFFGHDVPGYLELDTSTVRELAFVTIGEVYASEQQLAAEDPEIAVLLRLLADRKLLVPSMPPGTAVEERREVDKYRRDAARDYVVHRFREPGRPSTRFGDGRSGGAERLATYDDEEVGAGRHSLPSAAPDHAPPAPDQKHPAARGPGYPYHRQGYWRQRHPRAVSLPRRAVSPCRLRQGHEVPAVQHQRPPGPALHGQDRSARRLLGSAMGYPPGAAPRLAQRRRRAPRDPWRTEPAPGRLVQARVILSTALAYAHRRWLAYCSKRGCH
ncbi:hypothetical protein DFJ74DRAFT_459245 [Hyaloraphidium curvatum]|nr:hypothetical protein DFJ74DRAFT_459245 [Hyaloraphidium curvatum]